MLRTAIAILLLLSAATAGLAQSLSRDEQNRIVQRLGAAFPELVLTLDTTVLADRPPVLAIGVRPVWGSSFFEFETGRLRPRQIPHRVDHIQLFCTAAQDTIDEIEFQTGRRLPIFKFTVGTESIGGEFDTKEFALFYETFGSLWLTLAGSNLRTAILLRAGFGTEESAAGADYRSVIFRPRRAEFARIYDPPRLRSFFEGGTVRAADIGLLRSEDILQRAVYPLFTLHGCSGLANADFPSSFGAVLDEPDLGVQGDGGVFPVEFVLYVYATG